MVARETSVADGLRSLGLSPSTGVVAKLTDLFQILLKEAIPMGYLGPHEAGRLMPRHILESAAVLPLVHNRGPIADVGSGAGLPGLVLACLGAEVTLIESQAKRAGFLRRVSDRLEVGAQVLQARAEDVARSSARESFGVATARALAAVPVALELCLPLVAIGGRVLIFASPPAGDATDALGGDAGDGTVPILPEEVTLSAARGERDGGTRGAPPGAAPLPPAPPGPHVPSARGSGTDRGRPGAQASSQQPDPAQDLARRRAVRGKAVPSAEDAGGAAARHAGHRGSPGPGEGVRGRSLPPDAGLRAFESEQSLEALAEVAELVGGSEPRWEALAVPGAGGPRWVMIAEKVRPTPDRYPRRAGVPQRRPLV